MIWFKIRNILCERHQKGLLSIITFWIYTDIHGEYIKKYTILKNKKTSVGKTTITNFLSLIGGANNPNSRYESNILQA